MYKCIRSAVNGGLASALCRLRLRGTYPNPQWLNHTNHECFSSSSVAKKVESICALTSQSRVPWSYTSVQSAFSDKFSVHFYKPWQAVAAVPAVLSAGTHWLSRAYPHGLANKVALSPLRGPKQGETSGAPTACSAEALVLRRKDTPEIS